MSGYKQFVLVCALVQELVAVGMDYVRSVIEVPVTDQSEWASGRRWQLDSYISLFSNRLFNT